MRKLKTIGLVFFVLFSLVSVGYSACEGDINCSGNVDGSDLALVAADFGTTGCDNCDNVIARIDELEEKIAQLEAKLEHFTRIDNDIYIDGANLHIRHGFGHTDIVQNGLGNLIVGYNEERGLGADRRTGSHNIVVGMRNNFSSYGGLVVGYGSEISGEYASVSGGIGNTASGDSASVSGGRFNIANGWMSSISGGDSNEASGQYASISGGWDNIANGQCASVSGGINNQAIGAFSSVSGGRYNLASGKYSFVGGGGGLSESDGNNAFADFSSILGGWRNIAGDPNLDDHDIGEQSVVSAGSSNVASGERSAVSGGYDNLASGAGSSVSGGKDNIASALGTSVSGGNYTTVSDNYDWAAGDFYDPE